MQARLDGPVVFPLDPPLKWAGGKRWLVPTLRPVWQRHSHRRLVEPFCGGLAVALGLGPKRALLNDINRHLINFYRNLKKGFIFEIEVEDDPNAFYKNRDEFNDLIQNRRDLSRRGAELFYYLNRTCYNGLCRFNQQGEFNVPYGKYKRPHYRTTFTPYKHAFQNWEFSTGSFELLDLEPDDFVYADPPYDVPFRQYSKQGFSLEDQERLAEVLSGHSGPVIISNQATDAMIDLYKRNRFSLKFLEGRRMISCTGDRTPAKEVLAYRGVRL